MVGIEGIDTRALVRKIREGGVLKGTIAHASLFGAPDHAFTQEELGGPAPGGPGLDGH